MTVFCCHGGGQFVDRVFAEISEMPGELLLELIGEFRVHGDELPAAKIRREICPQIGGLSVVICRLGESLFRVLAAGAT
jgi:hypothetical protein